MELAYCVPAGIAHSEFLSWPADDQDKALAWLADQSHICKGCGTRRADWDPAQGGNRTAFIAELSRCLGCEELDRARQHMSENPDQHLGVHIGLVPNDEQDDEDEDDEVSGDGR
jgi:hypothetical protein